MGKEKNWLEKKLALLSTHAQKQELFEHLRNRQSIYTAQPVHFEVLRLRFFSEEQRTPTDEEIAQVLQCDPALVPVYERAALAVLDPFETTIDYTRSLQQMLDDVPLGPYIGGVGGDPNKILRNFSMQGTGTVIIEPDFVELDNMIGTSAFPEQEYMKPHLWPNERQLETYYQLRLRYVVKKFQAYDLKPARIEHLLAFGAQYPWETSRRKIIAPLASCNPFPENQKILFVAHLGHFSLSTGINLTLESAIQNKQEPYPNICIPTQNVPYEGRWSLLGFKQVS